MQGARETEFIRQGALELAKLHEESELARLESDAATASFCESPIERLFYLAILTVARMDSMSSGGNPALWLNHGADDSQSWHDAAAYHIWLSGPTRSGVLGETSIHGLWPDGGSAINYLFLLPQAQVGKYRVDFLFRRFDYVCRESDGAVEEESLEYVKSIVVECDGFDFHDRTKQQASRDRRRDRDLQSMGFQVFRYTGSDVYRHPMRCAREVLDGLLSDSA